MPRSTCDAAATRGQPKCGGSRVPLPIHKITVSHCVSSSAGRRNPSQVRPALDPGFAAAVPAWSRRPDPRSERKGVLIVTGVVLEGASYQGQRRQLTTRSEYLYPLPLPVFVLSLAAPAGPRPLPRGSASDGRAPDKGPLSVSCKPVRSRPASALVHQSQKSCFPEELSAYERRIREREVRMSAARSAGAAGPGPNDDDGAPPRDRPRSSPPCRTASGGGGGGDRASQQPLRRPGSSPPERPGSGSSKDRPRSKKCRRKPAGRRASRARKLAAEEAARAVSDAALSSAAAKIQNWLRARRARRRFLQIQRSVVKIQEFWRKHTHFMPSQFY